MELAFDSSLLQTIEHYLLAAAVASARIGAIIAVFPGFTRLGLSGILQGAIGLVLVLPLIPAIDATWGQNPHSEGETALLIFKEVIVGTVIALVLGVPFWAAEFGGSILDIQRGQSMGSLTDPANVEESNFTPTLFVLLMLSLFYGSGGFNLLLKTLYGSYEFWPAGQFYPFFDANAGEFFLKLLDDIFSMGLMLVIPIVFILLIADIVLAFVSRASPHLHVFDLSLSVKNLLVVLLLLPYLTFLVHYMKQDMGWLVDAEARLKAVSGASAK